MVDAAQIELTSEWIGKIHTIAPAVPVVAPGARRRALMFSRCLGYQHWVTPHTSAVVKVLAEKSGAFEVVETEDAQDFVAENLGGFDAVLLNNTCPTAEKRELFTDFCGNETQAVALKESVLDFVKEGGGFVAIHGGGLAYMFSPEWEAMQGASFDHHPPQQEVRLDPGEPDHPLLRAFEGEPFVHWDEPYLFVNRYTDGKVRTLLEMDASGMIWSEGRPVPPGPFPAAWIKPYGEGRVFFSSPSHNAQSFEDPRLLRFMLDGIQYALGDLVCDDRV